ncbi:hypothetical protein [Ammoniphilus sp. YIM 78166]|nr:hypothetical protein [Ammoniphilus sp. YIM 78166]
MEEAKLAARNLRHQKETGNDEIKEIFGESEEGKSFKVIEHSLY